MARLQPLKKQIKSESEKPVEVGNLQSDTKLPFLACSVLTKITNLLQQCYS